MGALTHNGEVMQGLPADASQINFDKTGTDLNSTQTENAIKEVNTKVNTNTADITQLKSGLIKPKYTSRVNISDYDSESNAYTAPSNGFVTFRFTNSAATNTGYNVFIDGVSMYSGYNNVEGSVNFTAPIGKGSTIYTTKQSNVSAIVTFVPYELG